MSENNTTNRPPRRRPPRRPPSDANREQDNSQNQNVPRQRNANNNNNFPPRQHPRRNNFHSKKKANDRRDHAGITMKYSGADCLICCQKSDLFGIGNCMHPVCMECAIRMRILGQSNACPQCRIDIAILYFVTLKDDNLQNLQIPKETIILNDGEDYGLRFENDYAVECFKSYTSHKCEICLKAGNTDVSFTGFNLLNRHMSTTHQLSFCYICTENINILTKDRKCYTRSQLLKHMQGQDPFIEGFTGKKFYNFIFF